MKKNLNLLIFSVFVQFTIFSQNTIPTTTVSGCLKVDSTMSTAGNLQVDGTGRIDSSLVVGDTMRAQEVVVGSDARIAGDINLGGRLLFDPTNNIGMNFRTGSASGSGTFFLGKVPATPLPLFQTPCAALPQPGLTYGIGANLQIYDQFNSTSGILNIQTWPNGSSIDASVGSMTGNQGLLINYFCGNNTIINTGVNGGIVFVGDNFHARRNVQIGPHWQTIDANVALDVYMSGLNDGVKIWPTNQGHKVLHDNFDQFTVWGNGSSHWGPNVQIGFAANTSIQDVNTSLNINSGTKDGIKLWPGNQGVKLIHDHLDQFTFWGNGNAHLGNNVQIGFAANSPIQDANTSLNINSGLSNNGLRITTGNDFSQVYTLKNTNSNKENIVTLGDGTTFIGDTWSNPGSIYSSWFPRLASQVTTPIGVNARAAFFGSVKGQSINEAIGKVGYCAAFETDNKNTRVLAVMCTDPTLGSLNANQFFEPFRVYGDGRTRIGFQTVPTHANALLSVSGEIVCKGLYVFKPVTWQDRVFSNDYDLQDLVEVEKFILKNKHLPGIKSEKEILENGYDVNEIDAALLEKIENLYLYIIKQQKEIDDLKKLIKK